MRTFEHSVAVRKRFWLRLAIAGQTGAGKSLSAQLLLYGFSLVDPGSVWVLNTEGANGLLYAPKPGAKAQPPMTFDFVNLPLNPPYRTGDYLAATQYAVANGAKHIAIDVGSLEHEEYLRFHEAEITRLVGKNDTYERRDKMSMAAWVRPSAERHAALLAFRNIEANIIWCFQGKEKVKLKKKTETRGDNDERIVDLGWQPIAGAEVVAELPIRFLLMPGADGVPSLAPELPGEKTFVRVPIELRQPGFLVPGRALDIELGKKLQQWAMPGEINVAEVQRMHAAAYDRAAILAEIKDLLKRSFPGRGKAVFQEVMGTPFEKEASLPPDRLLAGLQALKAKVPAVTPQPGIVDPGAAGGPFPAPLDDTRSTAATIREAAVAAGLSEERLLAICKGDTPEEVPDSPEILEEILDRIRKETA